MALARTIVGAAVAGVFLATAIEVAGWTLDVEFSFADAFRMP